MQEFAYDIVAHKWNCGVHRVVIFGLTKLLIGPEVLVDVHTN